MDRLDELALLVAILDGGTFAAGARKTQRSRASATRILSELEARLGTRLIERTTRRLVPTDAGRRLAIYARRLIADFDEAINDITGEACIPRGSLRISASLVFGRRHIAPVVREFLATHSEIEVELVLTNRIVDVVEEEIDVALRIGHLVNSSLIAKQVTQVRRTVVASPEYLSRHGIPTSLSDLESHEIVLQSTDTGRMDWQFDVPGKGTKTVKPRARLIVNQAETAIESALTGYGLIRVLSYQVADELANGRLIRVLQDFEPSPLPVRLVYASKRFLPLRTRTFIDFAVHAFSTFDMSAWV